MTERGGVRRGLANRGNRIAFAVAVGLLTGFVAHRFGATGVAHLAAAGAGAGVAYGFALVMTRGQR